MASLPTITLSGYANVSSTASVGSDPILEAIASYDDADYAYDSTNSTHTGECYLELLDMPSDFGTMATLAVQLRYHAASTPSLVTWDSLRARVYKVDGTTALTNEATVASAITTTTPTNSSVISFTGVDTAAPKTDWNAARLHIYWYCTRSKGGETIEKRVTAGQITGTYTAAVIYNFTPNSLDVAVPVFGTPLLTETFLPKNFNANNFATPVPEFGTPIISQRHSFAVNALDVSAPEIGSPVLTQKHSLQASVLNLPAPTLSSPTYGVVFSATSLTTPAPEIGTSTLAQAHKFTATSLATPAPEFGTPTLAVILDIELAPDVVDAGLQELLDVDQIYVCSSDPTSFAAVAGVALGVKDFGTTSIAFTGPSAGTPSGRKMVAAEISDGDVSGTGLVQRWAAVDSVAERLLARGIVAEPFEVTEGGKFSLASYDIRLGLAPIALTAESLTVAAPEISSPTFSSGIFVPEIRQMLSSYTNLAGVQGVAGDPYQYTLPNAVAAGNALVVVGMWPTDTQPVISDNINGTWPAARATLDTSGMYKSSYFVLFDAGAGVTTITATFGATVIPFQWDIYEISNVTAMNGSSTAVDAGASIACGAFTPTDDNDANGGNLILSYFSKAGWNGLAYPSSWTKGSGQTLLQATCCANAQYVHMAAQCILQATRASINPGMTVNGDTQDYNCISIALKVGAAGSGRPTSGLHINKVLHFTPAITGGNLNLQIPSFGNFRLLTHAQGMTSVVDNNSVTWTKLGSESFFYYRKNAPASDDATIVHNGTWDMANHSIRYYDVSNVDTTDGIIDFVEVTTGENNTAVDQPVITPSISSGLAIATFYLGTGPAFLGASSPAGAIYDAIIFPQQNDSDFYDNADAVAHLFFNSTATQHWTWDLAEGAGPGGWSGAVTIKAAS